MNDKQMQSNYIRIVGKINSNLELSHEVFGEKFYEFFLEVPRLSDTKDLLPVIISERIIDDIDMSIGNYIVIDGQFRSYNRYEDKSNKLLLRVFVRDITVPAYNELEELGTMHAVKEKGLMRLEGKDYVMEDGDIVLFRFNV